MAECGNRNRKQPDDTFDRWSGNYSLLRFCLGQTWNKGTQDCDGVAGRYNTKIAFSYNGLSSGRWRLPSMAELKSLIYCVEDKKISFIGSSVKDYCPQKASITSGVAKKNSVSHVHKPASVAMSSGRSLLRTAFR